MNHLRKYLWELPFKGKSAAWTALFTAMLACYSVLLYRVTNKTELANEAVERAFLFAARPTITRLMEHGSVKSYRTDMCWENSGATPARGAKILPSMNDLPNSTLPLYYDFPQNYEYSGNPKVTIGPKNNACIQLTGISSVDLDDMINQKKFLYVWGSVRYLDVFPDGPIHVTEFCYQFGRITSGDVSNLSTEITAEWGACIEHNCSDEDCPDYKKQIAGYTESPRANPTPTRTFPIPGL